MELAAKHYGTVKRMAKFWAPELGKRANNLRSQQLGSFKKVWLTCGAPYAIVTHVIKKDLKVKDRPMKVSPAVVESGLETVSDVRKCLKSENMYANPVMYNLICSGLESGKIKHMAKLKQPSTIRALLTIAHEAHIRLELYFCLEKQNYAHDPGNIHGEQRIRLWEKMCARVKADREQNAEAAERTRKGGASTMNDNVNEDDDSDDETPKKPRIALEYY